MKTPLANELPQHKSFPRYVHVGQAVADCEQDSRGFAVRLSTRCWISPARWNEIAQASATLAEAMTVALSEAHAARAAGKAFYAQICRKLDAMDHPGFESRRTTLARYAATIATK